MPEAVGNPGKPLIDRRPGERSGRLGKRHVGLPALEGRHQLAPDLPVRLLHVRLAHDGSGPPLCTASMYAAYQSAETGAAEVTFVPKITRPLSRAV